MTRKLKFIPYTLVALFLLVSCSKEEESANSSDTINAIELDYFDKSYIKNAPAKERVAYTNHHLLHLAKTINSTNPQFVKMFEQNANKDKDDDIQLSFQELFDNTASKGEIDEETQFALDAFLGVSDEDLVPTVRLIREGDIENPIILLVSYDVDKSQKFCYGYEFDDNGELVMFSDDVKEEDILGAENSKSSSTTLFIQARTDCDGNYLKSNSNCGGSGGGGGTSSRTLRINRFKVTSTKETWPARPEIRFKGYLVPNASTACSNSQKVTGSVDCDNASGKQIARIKRSEVGDDMDVNFSVDSNGTSYSPGSEHFAFVTFEYDGFPAPKVQAFPFGSVGPRDFKIDYRSWESPYATGTILERNLYPSGAPLSSTTKSTTLNGNDGEFRFIGR